MSKLPTVADLIERLRQVHEKRLGRSLSDEKLAGQLPFSLSTFNRWKKTDPRYFEQTVALLNDAGWLNVEASEETQPQVAEGSPEQILARLATLQAQVEELPTTEDMKRLGDTMRRAIVRASQASGGTPQASSGKNAS